MTVGTNSKDKLADLGADEPAIDAGEREPDTEEDGLHDAALLIPVLRRLKHADHGVGRVLEGALEEGDDEDDGDAHEEEGANNRPVELVEKEEVGPAPHRYSLFHRVEGFMVSKCYGLASAQNIRFSSPFYTNSCLFLFGSFYLQKSFLLEICPCKKSDIWKIQPSGMFIGL